MAWYNLFEAYVQQNRIGFDWTMHMIKITLKLHIPH